MDLERIFTLVVIMIIWGVSNAVRKAAKPNSKGPAPGGPRPGFFAIIQQNLAALEERSQGRESIPLDAYFQPAPLSQTGEPESLVEMTEDAREERATVPSAAPPETAKLRTDVLPKKVVMDNRRKLQNAIIWAEILAPPMALRDQ